MILQLLIVSGFKVLFNSFLPVDPPLYRCRRPSCHRCPLCLSLTLTTTILQSLSMSGLKALCQAFLPVDSLLYRCIRSSCCHRSHVYWSTKVGLWYWFLSVVFPLPPDRR